MKRNAMTPLQFAILTFLFLFGGSLLTFSPYRAEEGAWESAVLGAFMGVLWLGFLSCVPQASGLARRGVCLCLSGLLALLLGLSVVDFGAFWEGEVMAQMPGAIGGLILLLLALYAARRGGKGLGRYGESCLLGLFPLLAILLFGMIGGKGANLMPEGVETMRKALKTAPFVLLSSFGDAIALWVMMPFVIAPSSPEASASARAGAKVEKSLFPKASRLFAGKSPSRRGLFLGGIAAAALFCVTVLGTQARLGGDALTGATYPFVQASEKMHEGVLSPLFLLFTVTVYSVRLGVLLFSLGTCLGEFLPEEKRHLAPSAAAGAICIFLGTSALVPNLTEMVRKSFILPIVLILFEFFLPFFIFVISFLEKRLDLREKI